MKKVFIILLLIYGVSTFANGSYYKNSILTENIIELYQDIRKMSENEIERFLGKNWHKN